MLLRLLWAFVFVFKVLPRPSECSQQTCERRQVLSSIFNRWEKSRLYMFSRSTVSLIQILRLSGVLVKTGLRKAPIYSTCRYLGANNTSIAIFKLPTWCSACELRRHMPGWIPRDSTSDLLHNSESNALYSSIGLNIYGVNLNPVSSPMNGRGNFNTVSTCDTEFHYGKSSHIPFGVHRPAQFWDPSMATTKWTREVVLEWSRSLRKLSCIRE